MKLIIENLKLRSLRTVFKSRNGLELSDFTTVKEFTFNFKMGHMSFRCQKCDCEIRLDASLQSISRAQAKLLISKVTTPLSRTSTLPTKYIPQERLDRYHQLSDETDDDALISENFTRLENFKPDDLSQSFVYISDSEDVISTTQPPDDMDVTDHNLDDQLPDFSKIKTLNQVFEILLTNQDVSHPMCAECSDLLTDNYRLKFDQSQREKEYYISFLRKLKDREAFNSLTEEHLEKELNTTAVDMKKLQELEAKKIGDLETLELEHESLKLQLELLHKQLNVSGETQLRELFQLKNTLSLNLLEKQKKLDQTKTLYLRQLTHLDKIRKVNIYKKLFDILFEGDYGLINGFRLGFKIPWSECNVALGQIVLMLYFLQNKLSISLENYKLVPLGSKSYVIKYLADHSANPKSSTVLQLYSSNEFTLGKLFNFNKLDVSMIALLDIVSQFEGQLMKTDSELGFPYTASVREGTLGKKSIRVTSNGQWTYSCRYLLVNLNWMLSYASAQLDK